MDDNIREAFEYTMKQQKVPQLEWWAHSLNFKETVWRNFTDSAYAHFKDWYHAPEPSDVELFPNTPIKRDVVMKEICKACGHQQESAHNRLINRMRRVIHGLKLEATIEQEVK